MRFYKYPRAGWRGVKGLMSHGLSSRIVALVIQIMVLAEAVDKERIPFMTTKCLFHKSVNNED